jgi:hypothetical protein
MNTLKVVLRISALLLYLGHFASYAGETPTTLEGKLLNACKDFELATVQELIKKPGIDIKEMKMVALP